MRASDFITERKKKKRKSKKRPMGGYFYPGYSFFGNDDSSDAGGGDGGGGESMYESAIDDLVTKLPSLKKHDYDTIDLLMRQIAKKHRITNRILKDLFVKKFRTTPDKWLSGKLDESEKVDPNVSDEVEKFALWAAKQLNLKNMPEIELSMDTEEAQTNHHTGGHVDGSDHIWVYVNNRNLVDILRTVFHELVHVRQGELNLIKPGDSYPGSPIEAMADMLAGKFIKIYGEQNNHIFQ